MFKSYNNEKIRTEKIEFRYDPCSIDIYLHFYSENHEPPRFKVHSWPINDSG